MHSGPSIAERLDRALDLVLDGSSSPAAAASAGLSDDDGRLAVAAARLRSALPLPPVATAFESRLGAQLADGGGTRESLVAWALRHPGRLLVTGAVGSAVGVGVTAAVWRSTRRSSGSRWLHR